VVASEVRNLAQRSAKAARNTAALIKVSQDNTDHGVSSLDEVTEKLSNIMGRVANVNTVMDEISTASSGQANGIAEINRSVAEMKNLTGESSARAQQSAATSVQLSGQADELASLVELLLQVLDGEAVSRL